MALSVDQFVVRLSDSGLLSDSDVQSFRDTLNEQPNAASTQQLAEQLIRQKKLTEYQAKTLCTEDSSPLVMGEYVILDEIGRGGMGRVYKAFHRRMERIVALKTLKPDSRLSKSMERFQREVKAAGRLIHPNVVTALDANEHNGTPYLIMEYVEGENLGRAARRQRGLAVPLAVDYLLQAARGIDYAHRKGIVHRDIKPSNLLVDSEGTVKILDLGLARFESSSADGGETTQEADLTGVGDVIGTANYVAPEQISDKHPVDHRADIYSLGCTLYFLVTGRSMYSNRGDTLDKLFAHRNEPAPALCAAAPAAPPWLEEVFQKMVAKDPGQRYQSMAEVVEILAARLPELKAAGNTLTPRCSPEDPTATMPLARAQAAESSARSRRSRAWPRLLPLAALLLLIAGGAWAAGILFQIDTPAGTLEVELNEPGATVTLLDEQGTVEIRRKLTDDRLKVTVDPGRKQLRVEKDGFEFFSRSVTVTAEEGDPVRITLKPRAAPGPPPDDGPVTPTPVTAQQRELAEWVFEQQGLLNLLPPDTAVADSARDPHQYPRTVISRQEDLPDTPYRVWRISFAGRADFDDEDLAALTRRCAAAASVTNLNISNTAITSRGLAHLAALEQDLVELDIHGTAAAVDESLPHLLRCRMLRTLLLVAPVGTAPADGPSRPAISLTAVQRLKRELPKCYVVWHADRTVGLVLSLGGSVTYADNKGLRFEVDTDELPDGDFVLVGIHLAGARGAWELQDLRGLDQLEALNLASTQIRDSHLAWLNGFPSLTQLDLAATPITDECVPHLARVTTLKRLNVSGTELSAGAVGRLRAALPECEIEFR